MAVSGRIRRRLALAIVLTALIPILVAILIAQSMIRQSSDRFFMPEFRTRLDQSLGVYQELARAVKTAMRSTATAIAAREPLRAAAAASDRAALDRELAEVFPKYKNLVSLTVQSADGEQLASRDRGRPVDPNTENKLEVLRPLGSTDVDEEPPQLVAVFVAEKARFDELEEMSRFVDDYDQMARSRGDIDAVYLQAFALLLGITIIAAIGVGTLLARGVSSRIGQLADATKRVGAGDLSVRVPEKGEDEIGDLSRAFNRMLGEVEDSRSRIEYLQRIGAWQEMARRLAHEIKNPLTPIQLAVQELHKRYEGEDGPYRKLVDTTREIVEDEVGTLRRLVTEFSDFARLPQASLEEADLLEFLREQAEHLRLIEEELSELAGDRTTDAELASRALGVATDFELPDGPAMVAIDRQMLRRALLNLLRNSAQAIENAGIADGKITVRAHREGDYWVVDVDDNGPGIAKDLRSTIFDPYVTTKTYGTGLGLAIVKKIIVEHRGMIGVASSPSGGARVRISLPAAGTKAASAALDSADWQESPSSAKPRTSEAPATQSVPSPVVDETDEPPKTTNA